MQGLINLCSFNVQVLLSAGGHEYHGLEQLYKDFLEASEHHSALNYIFLVFGVFFFLS